MITCTGESAGHEATRWQQVQRGLRLANSHLGVALIGWFYALWVLIGVLLGFAMIPFALLGKMDAFRNGLNSVAMYGFLLPIALMAATTWAVKLFSRLLWCMIPEPRAATCLALISVVGRFSVPVALGYVWLSGGGFGKGLLLPFSVACSAVAWLGLIAEWAFIRVLRNDLNGRANAAESPAQPENGAEHSTATEEMAGQQRKSILARDVGEWFRCSFPRGYRLTVWVLLPLAYVVVCSLADSGNVQTVPVAALRVVVIAPAALQVFWIPNSTDKVISALLEKTAPESVH